MTKTIVLGEQPPKKTELKPIKFSKILMCDEKFEDTNGKLEGRPREFKFLELVCREYGVNNDGYTFDLIFAYNDPQDRSDGVLYTGQWNDGVVK